MVGTELSENSGLKVRGVHTSKMNVDGLGINRGPRIRMCLVL